MTIGTTPFGRRQFLTGLAAPIAATVTGSCGWSKGQSTTLTQPPGSASVRDARFEGGAKGDGIADDTAAIQAAIDTAPVVFIPAGTYIVSRSLILRKSLQIVGAGSSTILKKMHEKVDRLIVNASTANTGIAIEDLTIDGSRVGAAYLQGKDGIILSRCSGALLRNVTARNCLNDGIIIEYGDSNRVIGCSTYGNAKDGIYCSGSRNVTIEGNQCYRNSVAGIAIAATAEAVVIKNKLRNNRVDILLGRDAKHIRVTGNDCRSSGAFVVSGENLTAQTLNGRTYPAAPAQGWDWLYGASRCTLSDNYFGGSVRLILFDDGIVSGNICTGSPTQGLLLQGASRNRVTGNTISNWGADFGAIQLASLTAADAVPKSQGLPLRSIDNLVHGNKIARIARRTGVIDEGLRSRIYGNLLVPIQ